MPRKIEKKTWPEMFEAVRSGKKTLNFSQRRKSKNTGFK